jgi:1-acyl-sn-glycerol-3-phosphate acyltransferase
MAHLRSILFTDPAVVLATVVMGSISIAASFFDSTGRAPHRIARAWSRILLWVSGVKVRVEGLEKLDFSGSYVLVCNHLSLMDTPVVVWHVPLQFRFFAKQSLFRIPFLGTHLRRAGHLQVIYGDPRASIKQLSMAARLIQNLKVSILLFPEGGRSPGEILEFKEGAAYIAIKAGVPIVPLGISGTREILPIGSVIVRPGKVRLRIGDPILTKGLKLQDRHELTRRLQQDVAALAV